MVCRYTPQSGYCMCEHNFNTAGDLGRAAAANPKPGKAAFRAGSPGTTAAEVGPEGTGRLQSHLHKATEAYLYVALHFC